MEGDLAAAVHVDHRSTAGVERSLAGIGALAGGEDGRVLEQQHGVADLLGDDALVHLPLQLPGRQVVDGVRAETRDLEVDRRARVIRRNHGPSVRLWITRTGGPRGG